MQINPSFSIKGDYHFRPMNADCAPAYFYQGREVYRFNGQMMEHEGTLPDIAEPKYATVSFHPTQPVAAFHDAEGTLTLEDFKQNLVWQGANHCLSSLISADGEWVWAVSQIDKQNLKVLLYRYRDGKVVSTLDVPDELYDSSIFLSDIPGSDAVTMELAAGQDGVSVYLLDYEANAIRAKELFPKACYIAPVWNPDGTRFLTLENDENTLAWFSYPQIEKLGEEEPFDDSEEDEWDNSNGYYQVYLKNGMAVVQTNINRYYLYSPQSMERAMELVIAGFSPKPTCEIFPNLKEDDSPYGEIEIFSRLGQYLVANTCRRAEGATQDLLIFQEDQLIDSIKEDF